MLADRKWVERNLGFDPITTPPPRETFAVKRMADAAVKRTAKVTTEDFQREIIDFDSESSAGRDNPVEVEKARNSRPALDSESKSMISR